MSDQTVQKVADYFAQVLNHTFSKEQAKSIYKTNAYGYALQIISTLSQKNISEDRMQKYLSLAQRTTDNQEICIENGIFLQDQTSLFVETL